MKRKYYLRGLGFGILITALVFIFAGSSEISDEEVIKRAEELGYVKEEQVTPSIGIKELLETGTPVPTKMPEAPPTEIPEPTIIPTPTVELIEEPAAEPTEEPAPTSIPEPTATETPVPTETPIPTETPVPTEIPEVSVISVTIVVERGNTASIVCDKIEAAGIIKSSSELKNYLVEHGLADYINIGSYTLSSDMTMEEISEIITGQ